MSLNDNNLEMVAERFRVLGDPLRLRLLNTLADQERSVAELVDSTESSQANVSKHLGVLLRAGLVRRRKEGYYVYYSCSDPSVFQLCNVVCGSLKTWLAGGLSQLEGPKRRSRRSKGA
jgi:DNA-binding transcriptional ArsR family regulator